MQKVGKNILEAIWDGFFGGAIILIPIIIGGLIIHFLGGVTEETIQKYLIYICVTTGILILIGFLNAYFFSETNDDRKNETMTKKISRWLFEWAGVLWIIFYTSLVSLIMLLFFW